MGLLDDAPAPQGLLGYAPPTTPTGATYGDQGVTPSALLGAIWQGISHGFSPQGFTDMARQGLQQQSDFMQGNDPNTGQPAVTPYDRLNTLAHFVTNNIGPQAVGGAVAGPIEGALGAGPIRSAALDMSDAARMQRAADIGYRPETLFHADRGATDATALPSEYPRGLWMTRDKDYAAGVDQTGAGPREFMTNPGRTFQSQGTLGLKDYSDIVSAVEKRYGAAAAKPLIDQVAQGQTSDWLRGMAAKQPDLVVSDAPGLHVFQPLVKMTGNEQEAGAIMHDAGFRSIDTGTHLWNLNGQGVRLKSAAFDPADAHLLDITKSLLPPVMAGGLLYGPSNQ